MSQPSYLSTSNTLHLLHIKEPWLQATKNRDINMKRLAFNIDFWNICITHLVALTYMHSQQFNCLHSNGVKGTLNPPTPLPQILKPFHKSETGCKPVLQTSASCGHDLSIFVESRFIWSSPRPRQSGVIDCLSSYLPKLTVLFAMLCKDLGHL